MISIPPLSISLNARIPFPSIIGELGRIDFSLNSNEIYHIPAKTNIGANHTEWLLSLAINPQRPKMARLARRRCDAAGVLV